MSNNRPQSELYREACERFVALDAKARLLEDTRSVVFAQMCSEMTGDFPGYSIAKVEQKIKASDRWEAFIRSMVDARTKANEAKVAVEVARMKYWEQSQDRADERFVARTGT